MGEVRIITEKNLAYEGLFDAKEFYRLIEEFFETKGYDKDEQSHREIVTPEGKDVHIE